MARFSVGREDDVEGPSSPRPKRIRTNVTLIRRRLNPHLHYQRSINAAPTDDELVEELEEVHSEEEEEEQYDDQNDDGQGEEEEELEEEEQASDHQDEEVDFDREDEELVGEHLVDGQNGGIGEERGSDGRDSSRSSVDGSISVTLTDPDVLDCPICLEALSIPVFQCENGHTACSPCCRKLKHKCPSCSLPIGYNRCRAIEKVLESVRISCRNMKHGCKETMSYSKKHDHEQTCIHASCSCPLSGCSFVGSSKQLYKHFSNKHPNSATSFSYDDYFSVSLGINQKHIILRERTEGMIFILNKGIECLGNVVNINCIGPSSSKIECSYDLIARDGASYVILQCSAKNIARWFEHLPPRAFLLLPKDLIGSHGQIKFQIRIKRPVID
ncbi:hypothetical protein RJ640_010965 [Escallonia rubra]|uniref:RING-type E3 ubiquitin transferase n=1 Tax=Escallonia rubra TaxID=112253 RepID=A0AA88SCL8_9ASTE|nr:hypothetical protein RJ640_010965 [Escallonia rubra]